MESSLSEEQIDELVRKSQKGDSEAFSELYDLLITPVYRYFYYRAPKNDVEDLTGTLFLKVWEKIKRYKKRKVPFSAWVFRIAHNLLVDHYRTQKTELELNDNFRDRRREASPADCAENSLSSSVLKVAMAKLKKNHQQVVILKFINELDTREVARVLRKREGAVRVLQFRALAELKKVLAEMGVKGDF